MFNTYPVNSTTTGGREEVKNREAEDALRCSMWLKLTSNILPLILMFEIDVDHFQFLPRVHGNKFALMTSLQTYNVCELAFCADKIGRNASILQSIADEMVPNQVD